MLGTSERDGLTDGMARLRYGRTVHLRRMGYKHSWIVSVELERGRKRFELLLDQAARNVIKLARATYVPHEIR